MHCTLKKALDFNFEQLLDFIQIFKKHLRHFIQNRFSNGFQMGFSFFLLNIRSNYVKLSMKI